MHEFSVNPVTLLVHLENPPTVYRGKVPIEEVVLAGLTSPTSYWVELAVDWIEAGFPLNHVIVQQLESMASSLPRSHQSLRHRCMAIARKWHQGM
jgi:hypothetical protein